MANEDIVMLMESVINRVKQGSLDIRVANTIGYLAGVSQKAKDRVKINPLIKQKRTMDIVDIMGDKVVANGRS